MTLALDTCTFKVQVLNARSKAFNRGKGLLLNVRIKRVGIYQAAAGPLDLLLLSGRTLAGRTPFPNKLQMIFLI